MVHRSLSTRLALVALLASALGLGLATTGCSNAPPKKAVATTPASNELAGAALTAPVGEQRLDTRTPVAPTPADRIAVTNAPLTANFRAGKARKPGSDENLPRWVPLRGRLTVVEAPDLAENLGLVPKGATKTAGDARISVAELMANGAGANGSSNAGSPASSTSATWLASNGRVRHGRGR